jgi:uncharacterized membrane protein YdjX (TVP38/TMEM64 family)
MFLSARREFDFGIFFLASLVGRIPGMILLSLAGVQVENILRRPDAISLILLGLTLVLLALALNGLFKRALISNQRQKHCSQS